MSTISDFHRIMSNSSEIYKNDTSIDTNNDDDDNNNIFVAPCTHTRSRTEHHSLILLFQLRECVVGMCLCLCVCIPLCREITNQYFID